MAIKLKFDLKNKKLNSTRWGGNVMAGDEPKLAGWVNAFKEMGLQVIHYNNLTGIINDTLAAQINTFLTATGAGLSIHYPVENNVIAEEFPKYLDDLKRRFKIELLQWSNESLSTPSGMTNAEYISRCLQMLAYDPSQLSSWDLGLLYRYPNKEHVARNVEIAKQKTPPIMGRQYEQIHPDLLLHAGAALTTNQDANFTVLKNCLYTTRPKLRTDFKTALPNLTKKVILQWHNEDAGTSFIKGKPLGNWMIGEWVRDTLANTEEYAYMFWMSLGNLITKTGALEPEGISIKRVSNAFKARYIVPLEIKMDGVTGIGTYDGVDSFSMILNNEKNIEHTITANEIKIFGKNISGLMIRNSGFAQSWISTQQNEEVADIATRVKPFSVNCITFKTSQVIGES